LAKNPEEMKKYVQTIDLDIIGADPERCGLKGSPTIVAWTEKVGDIGGNCKMHEGHSADQMVDEVIEHTNLKDFLVAKK
jgi:electron transfer flavoprotein beta subunit